MDYSNINNYILKWNSIQLRNCCGGKLDHKRRWYTIYSSRRKHTYVRAQNDTVVQIDSCSTDKAQHEEEEEDTGTRHTGRPRVGGRATYVWPPTEKNVIYCCHTYIKPIPGTTLAFVNTQLKWSLYFSQSGRSLWHGSKNKHTQTKKVSDERREKIAVGGQRLFLWCTGLCLCIYIYIYIRGGGVAART